MRNFYWSKNNNRVFMALKFSFSKQALQFTTENQEQNTIATKKETAIRNFDLLSFFYI